MIFLKEKKSAAIKFEPGSKLPVIFYGITAVILSCLFMMLALITSGFSFTVGRSLSIGDINNDGKVSAADALQIIMRENKKVDFNGAQIDAADINGDGVINRLDATLIVQYASESSDKLGVLAQGNTSMEAPAPVKAAAKPETSEAADKNQSSESEAAQTVEANADSFVRSGTSYGAAFCTSDSDIYTTARIVNRWQANGKNMYQVEIVLKNNSGSYIGDSSLDLVFNGAVSVEKSWKCNVDDSDYGLQIVTDCGAYVPNGGSMKCGLIVSSPSVVEIESVSK